jgi:hypothetical protein
VLLAYLFWGGNGQLLVQSVNVTTLAPLGEPLPLARPLYQSVVAAGYPAFDVSPLGAVAFFPGLPEPMQFEWLGRRGESLGTTGPSRSVHELRPGARRAAHPGDPPRSEHGHTFGAAHRFAHRHRQ